MAAKKRARKAAKRPAAKAARKVAPSSEKRLAAIESELAEQEMELVALHWALILSLRLIKAGVGMDGETIEAWFITQIDAMTSPADLRPGEWDRLRRRILDHCSLIAAQVG
jgi:hypothetical protein